MAKAAEGAAAGGTIGRKLAALLASEATERQIAAAIVAGELGVRDAAVIDGLTALVKSGLPPLQRHAVEALGRLGAKRALPDALPLLASRDEGVRRAAAAAVASFGDAALPALRARLQAAEPDERRSLEEALARLGGKDAFAALLAGLDTTNVEAARAAALAVRPRIKDADARERRAYLAEVKRFLGLATTRKSPAATVAGLRLLGFLEDETVAPLLLSYATSAKQTDEVRGEALISLRFVAQGKPARQKAVAEKLLAVAESAPVPVARTALYTLASLPVPAALARRLGKLATHPEGDRALLAIERLAQMPGGDASQALGSALLEARDRARAEAAAAALSGRPDAGATLARALLEAPDADRANMLARLLRAHLRALDAKLVRALRDAAIERIAAGRAGWEPFLSAAREADATGTAAGLRACVDRLRKAKKPERALEAIRALARGSEATPEDGYALASLELAHGRREEGLTVLGQLLDRGYDVPAAMARDRALDLTRRYQVGFHFAERRHPAAEEILSAVATAGGRSKVGQMARAKLRSSGFVQ